METNNELKDEFIGHWICTGISKNQQLKIANWWLEKINDLKYELHCLKNPKDKSLSQPEAGK